MPSSEAAREEISAAARAWSAAFVRGDTATIGDLYTPDAVVLVPGREVRGREAITRFFVSNYPGFRMTSHRMEARELTVHDSIALDLGTWHQSWRRIDGDEERSFSDTYLAVWRRGPDGRWRMQYDMAYVPAAP
jgi:uncharacterized protein (TIGR02246 family)